MTDQLKPWQMPLLFWGIFEIEPRMSSKEFPLLFGQYKTEEEAIKWRDTYFADISNVYIKQYEYTRGGVKIIEQTT